MIPTLSLKLDLEKKMADEPVSIFGLGDSPGKRNADVTAVEALR